MVRSLLILIAITLAVPASARQTAQPPTAQPPASQPPATPSPASPPATSAAPGAVPETTSSDRREVRNDQKDWHFIGHVEMDRDPQGGSKLFADDVWVYMGQDKMIATGNVLLTQGPNRISAERAEFNTKDSLGTFYNAWGMATVKPQKQRPTAVGAVAPPPVAGQENVIIFFGEKVEKIAPKKYKITNGGFSTCAQPTPRWDLHAGTVILNVDHYTVLTNAVMEVKGVPLFYLPVLYYPTKREDRATGFLIPTYGTSSLRGQSIHDAFFWAIDRSQDATIMHDWFSKTGQGVGSEYRYNFGSGTDGNIRAYLLDEHSTTYIVDGVETAPTTASRSFEIRGGANQLLPGGLRARANVNYFSDIVASQQFNTNIYDISRNQRSFGGNVVGAWGTYTLNTTIDHSEYFTSQTDSVLTGSWPRVNFSRNERPIGNSPAYFSISTEYAHLLGERNFTSTDENGAPIFVNTDSGLSRFDISPQIRYPFKKWQWFTVNTTASVRDTYYTRSYLLNPDGTPTTNVVDEPLNRKLFTVAAQVTGPVFNRVWDTPENGYAEKFKHTIEPVFTVQKLSSYDESQKIVVFDATDSAFGGTNVTYGLNNRFYAKRRGAPGQPSLSRDILDVEVSQSYYNNAQQSVYDPRYQTSLGATASAASNFSPLALNVRGMPTNEINATVRAEFDSRYHSLSMISAQGSYSWAQFVQANLGWSKRTLTQQLAGVVTSQQLDHSVNGSVNVRTRDNKYGTQYNFSYDVHNGGFTQQRITGFYNAQCCGLAMEYDTYNYGVGTIISPIPADHRFFLSFTLAGLGNFSPFNGALSGVPR